MIRNRVLAVFPLRPSRMPEHYSHLFRTQGLAVTESLLTTYSDRTKGTCNWFPRLQELQRWSHAKNYQFLWLRGEAGAGKSTLLAYTISLMKRRVTGRAMAVVYTFCPDNGSLSATDILCTAFSQLLSSSKAIQNIAMETDPDYIVRKEGLSTQGTSRKPVDLWNLFREVIQQSDLTRVFFIIDGFDNCRAEVQRTLMELFSDGCPNLSILIASQHLERLRSAFWDDHRNLQSESSFQELEINEHDNEINRDIQLYLEDRIAKIANRTSWTPDDGARVLDHLSSQKDGIFLPFVLSLDSLEFTDVSQIQTNLQGIFRELKDVGKLYRRLLGSMAIELGGASSNILKFVLYAERPLKLSEIGFCIRYCQNPLSFPHQSALNSRFLQSLRRNIELYRPMLRLKKDDTVDFLHSSARKFLTEANFPLGDPMHGVIAPPHRSHFDLAKICLNEIRSSPCADYPDPTEDWRATKMLAIKRKQIFLGYALEHWHYHVACSLNDQDLDPVSIAELKNLLKDLTRIVLQHKYFACEVGTRHGQYIFSDDEETTELVFYSSLGSPVMVREWLLTHRHNLDAYQDSEGVLKRALRVATRCSDTSTTVLLLENCLPASFTKDQWAVYLMNAAENGNPETLARLFNLCGRAPDLLAQTAVMACVSGNPQLLSVIGSNLEALLVKDKMDMTFLHRVATCPKGQAFTRDAVLDVFNHFIVDRSLDPSVGDRFGRTILHHLCWDISTTYLSVIQKVVEMGADPNRPDKYGCLPIHLAACRSAPEVVVYLIDHTGDSAVTVKSNGGLTPLHWAMCRHFDSYSFVSDFIVIQELLRRGARLDRVSVSGRTPLAIGCENPIMSVILSLVFFRFGGYEDMHGQLALFLDVWSKASSVEQIWNGLQLNERLPAQWRTSALPQDTPPLSRLAHQYYVLRALHPRQLMEHLMQKSMPDSDELDAFIASESYENDGMQELMLKVSLWRLMNRDLCGDSDSDSNDDNENEKNHNSNGNDDRAGEEHETTQSDHLGAAVDKAENAASASNRTRLLLNREKAWQKMQMSLKIWFMFLKLLEDVAGSDDITAYVAQGLLSSCADKTYREKMMLTGITKEINGAPRQEETTSNGNTGSDVINRTGREDSGDISDDVDGAADEDTATGDLGRQLAYFLSLWLDAYETKIQTARSEPPKLEQLKNDPLYMANEKLFQAVHLVREYDAGRISDEPSDEPSNAIVTATAARQNSFHSTLSQHSACMPRHRRLFFRPVHVMRRIRSRLTHRNPIPDTN